MFRFASFTRLTIVYLTMTALSSCAVGPDFHSPDSPSVTRYTQKAIPTSTVSIRAARHAGEKQRFVADMNIPAAWWQVFHAPSLNALIVMGLKNNQDLAASYAALRVSQETLTSQIGSTLWPAIDVTGGGERTRPSVASGLSSSVFNVFNANVNVSYALDAFGGLRRQVESLSAQVDFQQFELLATRLTLTSNIVTTAIAEASLHAQIEATHHLVHAQERQLVILRKQFALGAVSREIVLTQETLLEQTRATLPALQQQAAVTQHALSVLVGVFPEETLPRIRLRELALPTQLPVSLPSRLVQQRPDVRAAEALLHAASANIGVATANLLPQINLTATNGFASLTMANLFSSQTKTWALAAQVTQPLFHGGALFATRRKAIAAYDVALAQYRQIVLQAFQNVADTLQALDNDARVLVAQKKAEIAAYRNLILAKRQYALGGVDFLFVLNAEQQYQSAIIARIQAEALRYTDTAALFQALGGGWWNQEECSRRNNGERGDEQHDAVLKNICNDNAG